MDIRLSITNIQIVQNKELFIPNYPSLMFPYTNTKPL